MRNILHIIITALLLSSVFSLMAGCEYDYIIPEKVVVGDSLSFSGEVQPIFTKNCALGGCHVGAAAAKGLDLSDGHAWTSLSDAAAIDTIKPENSLLITKIATGGSMATFVTAGERSLILTWIQQGGKDN